MNIQNVQLDNLQFVKVSFTFRANTHSFNAQRSPQLFCKSVYRKEFNPDAPYWASLFRRYANGHRGSQLVAAIYEDALDAAEAGNGKLPDRSSWECVALYAAKEIID